MSIRQSKPNKAVLDICVSVTVPTSFNSSFPYLDLRFLMNGMCALWYTGTTDLCRKFSNCRLHVVADLLNVIVRTLFKLLKA